MRTLFLLVFAGLVANAQTKPSIFETPEVCNTALASKDFAYYAPVFTEDKAKNPIDDVKVFGVKLEADQCRHQFTVKGWKWVVQAGETLMRARKDASGELVIFARNDCGNLDNTPAPPQPTVAPTPAPRPVAAVPPRPTPATPTAITAHVDGKVEVVHSGTVDVRHSGAVEWNPIVIPPPKARCGKGCKTLIGVGIAGGIAGGIFATRGKSSPTPGRPPGGNTGLWF